MANIKQVKVGSTLYDIEALKATQDGSGNVITSTYATKAVATTSAKGLMSAEDKITLDNLTYDYFTTASNEEFDNKLYEYINDSSFQQDVKYLIMYPKTGVTDRLPAGRLYFLQICKSSNNTGTIFALGYNGSDPRMFQCTWSSNSLKDWVDLRATATTDAKGLMSAEDKIKLDSILPNNLIDLEDRGTEIVAGTDLNDLKTPGRYYSPSSGRTAELINAPYSGGGFRLFVFNSHNNSAKIQLLMGYGNVLFYRFYLASSNEDNPRWKEWVNLITIDPSLAGNYGPTQQELPEGGALLPDGIFSTSDGYGGTSYDITVPAFTIDNNGKITEIHNQLYLIKDTTSFPDATTSKSGFMSAADKTKLNGLSDTKVTQKAVITTDGNYPVILGNSTATTEVTGTVNKSSKLLFNPSSGILDVNRITISNTSGIGHITFSRLTSYNYLHVPSSETGAALCVCINGTLSKANSTLVVSKTDVTSGQDSTYNFGTDSNRWKGIYTDAIDSGGGMTIRHTATKGTAPTSASERTIKFTDSTGGSAAAAARLGMVYNTVNTSNNVTTAIYAYQANSTETSVSKRLYVTMNADGTSASGSSADKFTCSKVYGAVWNDYAEFRICNDDFIPGQVVCENGDDTLSISNERLQPGANIISDTFGFAIGETDEAKCPIAVSGRVLAYTYEPREEFQAGDAVCAGPNGTVSKMTREEIREYPDRIIGTVSAIPNYEEWGTGKVSVNNRIWIKI